MKGRVHHFLRTHFLTSEPISSHLSDPFGGEEEAGVVGEVGEHLRGNFLAVVQGAGENQVAAREATAYWSSVRCGVCTIARLSFMIVARR